MDRAVTQADIAKALGISRSTVALAVRKTESPLLKTLNAETVRRIRAKAEEMGYYANLGAQTLRKKRSNLLLYLNFENAGEKSAERIYHTGRLVHAAGYDFRVIDAHWWVDSPQAFVAQLMGLRPEGILVCGYPQLPMELSHIREFMRQGIPVVGLNFDAPDIPVVRHDPTEAIREITAGMIASGRRRLALLLDGEETWQRRAREEGFLKAFAEVGGPAPEKQSLTYTFSKNVKGLQSAILIDSSRPVAFHGFERELEAARKILQNSVLPDALICSNDAYAMAVLTQCQEMEISVPASLCVSGFDNLSYGLLGGIRLTSVDRPIGEMCDSALKMLLRRIDHPEMKEQTSEKSIFPCQVIWRTSCPQQKFSDQQFLPLNI